MKHLLALLLLLTGSFVTAQEIVVAAAADMSAALPQLVETYTKKTGQAVKISFGSSGNLTNQIRNGAPFDVFFSADEEYPRQLIAEGLAAKDTLYRYAVGRLVLWVPGDSPLDLSKLGMKALLDPSVKKIAIANPVTAPYGRAAEAALRHFGIYDQVSSRLVLGENVSQAAQFVESGNAQTGLIALSHALAPALKGKGRYWTVPLEAYPTLNQATVVLSRSKQQEAARRFLEFLRSSEARSLLGSYGFSVAGGTLIGRYSRETARACMRIQSSLRDSRISPTFPGAEAPGYWQTPLRGWTLTHMTLCPTQNDL
jgi:molybdate transport system substrate-binding protein